jgi:hypothetical protein
MSAHSHPMWSRGPPCSQLMWSGNWPPHSLSAKGITDPRSVGITYGWRPDRTLAGRNGGSNDTRVLGQTHLLDAFVRLERAGKDAASVGSHPLLSNAIAATKAGSRPVFCAISFRSSSIECECRYYLHTHCPTCLIKRKRIPLALMLGSPISNTPT